MKKTKYLYVLSLVLLLVLSQCMVKKEPEVYNLRKKIVTLAKSLVGLPYRFGGEEIDGFDCSGFVHYVYDSYGIKLPRTAKEQSRLKPRFHLSEARRGDIMAFKFNGRWHTVIYAGKNKIIHAPNRKSRVRIENIGKSLKKNFKWAVRVIKD